jgi:hypothetical protein
MPEWEGFERFTEPLKKFRETFFEKNMKTYAPNSGISAWNVLNHGDFMMKNCMVKKNQETKDIEDFMIVSINLLKI